MADIENVVLIVIDALRRDRVDLYNENEGELTPHINSLAEDGEVFEECYSCINATDSSVTTILTGLYPTSHGVLNQGKNVTETEKKYVSGTTPLPERINKSHNTIAVDTLERWHSRGFDSYLNPRKEKRGTTTNIASRLLDKLPAEIRERLWRLYQTFTQSESGLSSTITDEINEQISASTSPFFLFAHFWDTHIPYDPPENYSELVSHRSYQDNRLLEEVLEPIEGPWGERLKNTVGSDETVSSLKQKYDACTIQADQAVGDVVETLKNEGVYDQTAIIITSDHGESFTEHNIIFDHHGLYDSTIRVPLIIHAPGFEGRESQFVQHFDLAPTILDLLNKEFNREDFDGVSLLAKERKRDLGRNAVFVEEGHTTRKRAVRTEEYKYIKRIGNQDGCRYCDIIHGADKELYRLFHDSEEVNNKAKKQPSIVGELNTKMESWSDGLQNPSTSSIRFEPSDEVEEHLEEMGYL